MAAAARTGDASKYGALAVQLKDDGPTAIIYLTFLLGQVVVQQLGVANPSDQQLHELTQRASLNLQVIGRFNNEDAELVLRDLFATPSLDNAPKGSMFVLYAGALLGALVSERDLLDLRSYLVRKCMQLAEQRPETLGFLRQRRGRPA